MHIFIDKIREQVRSKLHDRQLRDLVSGGAISFVFRIVGLAAGYLFTLLITWNYGPVGMGIFMLCLTFINISTVVGKLGLDTALLRFVAEFSTKDRWAEVNGYYKNSLKIAIPFSILLSFLLVAGTPFIAKKIFGKPQLEPYLIIASLAIFPMVMRTIHAECLRGLKKILEYSFFQQAAVNISSCIIMVLCWVIAAGTQNTPIIVFVVSTFIAAVASIFLWYKNTRKKVYLETSCSQASVKELLAVSLPMLFAGSLQMVMLWTDTLMLGVFRSEYEVGVYAVSLKLASLTSVALMSINSISAPKFAELYGKDDMLGLQDVVKKSTKMIFWCSMPILICFLTIPKYILQIFGEGFELGVTSLILLTVSQFISAASGSVGFLLQMTGRQNIFQKIILLASILNVVLNLLLIPKYGINGAAISSLSSMVFWNIMAVLYISKEMNIRTFYIPLVD